jgi:Zn finger protein HypA/HybF involved in hydrogenase expression
MIEAIFVKEKCLNCERELDLKTKKLYDGFCPRCYWEEHEGFCKSE